MGRKYLSLGKVGVLTNRDVRDSVQAMHATPLPPPVAQGSSSHTPQKRSAETLVEEPSAESETARRNRAGNKKLKLALYGRDDELFGAGKSLPDDMQKYWAQRYRLWSKFDEGIKMDKEGWWSVTPEGIAKHQAERLRSELVVDAFCGCGGNTIQLAFTCKRVIAIDNNPFRLACASHNAEVYGVADHITFIQADFLSWSTAYSQDPSNQPVDAVYLSPPWGGLNYLLPGGEYSLDQLQPPGAEIMTAARRLSNNIALFIPRNSSLSDISSLGSGEVEVEEVFMSGKLKALTAYYGDLSRRK